MAFELNIDMGRYHISRSAIDYVVAILPET
jgi:hypothetical protein